MPMTALSLVIATDVPIHFVWNKIYSLIITYGYNKQADLN